ncbi:AI-2E family transporter [Salinirubellus sp. GCM10025818]|uniref:AI-2E family transporter n=1 Tax=Salinirubellus TaxID=2162630 RepID=UPI0030D021F6
MPPKGNRRRLALTGLLAGTLVLAAIVLLDVLSTVFFAVTIAYVLYPVRRWLSQRGLSERAASAAVATGAFAAVLALVLPLGFVLYRRRRVLFDLLEQIPDVVEIPLGTVVYTVDTVALLDSFRGLLGDVALGVAAVAPVLALQLFLFAILLYALMLRPGGAGEALLGVVPPEYHDVVRALDRRIRETLFGIYVLQAATAAGTFVVALVVFFLLGYGAPFTLAVFAAVLQFVPVVGPSVLIGTLAVVDVLAGNVTRAVLVAVVGAVFVGFAPDAIIRPRLANWAAHLPTSLYFIGFTGGILTVGPIGFIAGPLAVAVLVEVVSLLADEDPVDHGTGPK